MNRRALFLLKMSALLILLSAPLVGCAGSASHDEISSRQYAPPEYWWTSNPCGYLGIQRHLFNVSGWLTGPPEPSVTVDLYVAPNDSLDTALDVVVHCRQIGSATVDEKGRFTLANLPAGTYFVALPSREFTHGQGFPIIDEYEASGHIVRMIWYGGSISYSIGAFSVSPRTDPDGPRRISP